MWVYWQGVRGHIEHDVRARELDFLVNDDLVRREGPSNDLHLMGHLTTLYELKGHLNWCDV